LSLALILAALTFQADDGARLSTDDLPAYHRALESSDQPAEPAGFRDLWEHPDSYRDRRVRVEGELARRFAQPAFGAFPPLVESWIVTPGDNPICLVYPETVTSIPIGRKIRFDGTFLRTIRYGGGDAPRLAPLVVGGEPPSIVPEESRADGSSVRLPSWVYWSAALIVVASLALLLAWLHLQGPGPSRRIDHGPVEFEDGEGGPIP
jgi:hypothetical protein